MEGGSDPQNPSLYTLVAVIIKYIGKENGSDANDHFTYTVWLFSLFTWIRAFLDVGISNITNLLNNRTKESRVLIYHMVKSCDREARLYIQSDGGVQRGTVASL